VGTVILEGIGKQLDPSVNLLDEAKPFLFKSELGREIAKESAKNLAGSIFNKAKIIVSPAHSNKAMQ
jgi:predicted unusual protein kinase regulating ubiquinone biosynthesis (AarF/ABC1/UbiB family)